MYCAYEFMYCTQTDVHCGLKHPTLTTQGLGVGRVGPVEWGGGVFEAPQIGETVPNANKNTHQASWRGAGEAEALDIFCIGPRQYRDQGFVSSGFKNRPFVCLAPI